MQHIQIERHEAVLVATMNRGKSNALSSDLVDDLLELVALAENEPDLRTLVLCSASDRIFCAGFDVEEVFGFDEGEMGEFLTRFVDAIEGMRSLRQTVVVAVSGHAYAGGALLALAGDLRLMPDTDLNFAIPEAELGVNMPLEMTGWLTPIPHGVLREMLLCAAPLRPRRALEIGFASRVVPPERLREEALDLARDLANKAPRASAGIKAGLNAMAGGVMNASERSAFVAKFVQSWYSEESVTRRTRLARRLGKTGD